MEVKSFFQIIKFTLALNEDKWSKKIAESELYAAHKPSSFFTPWRIFYISSGALQSKATKMAISCFLFMRDDDYDVTVAILSPPPSGVIG